MDDLCCSPLMSCPLSRDDAGDLAQVLKALANPVRLRLMSIIAASDEACACEFPALLSRSQPTVSHHLSQLTNAGLLEREQRGKWAWFRVNPSRLAQIRSVLA